VRALLPEALAEHVTGAVLHVDTVVVLVDSAAWASRLRFHAPELVARLAPRYDGAVTRVRVKVRPPADRGARRACRRRAAWGPRGRAVIGPRRSKFQLRVAGL
jgi:hypothetical protein